MHIAFEKLPLIGVGVNAKAVADAPFKCKWLNAFRGHFSEPGKRRWRVLPVEGQPVMPGGGQHGPHQQRSLGGYPAAPPARTTPPPRWTASGMSPRRTRRHPVHLATMTSGNVVGSPASSVKQATACWKLRTVQAAQVVILANASANNKEWTPILWQTCCPIRLIQNCCSSRSERLRSSASCYRGPSDGQNGAGSRSQGPAPRGRRSSHDVTGGRRASLRASAESPILTRSSCHSCSNRRTL